MKKVSGWIKGIVSSLLLLLLAAVDYGTLVSSGLFELMVTIGCTMLAMLLILTLIYAIENDDFRSGFAIPFIAISALVIGYFGQAPVGFALLSCLLGAMLATILVQEGD